MILPQKDLKAKDLPRDLLPPKQVLEAYKDAGQEFVFDSDATIQDRNWRWFCAQVNGNVRIANQEIEQRVCSAYRFKNAKGEWLMYHILLSGTNHLGEKVDFSYREGKIELIPEFERKVNPDTGEVEYTQAVRNHRTEFTIPFSKKALDNLTPYFTENAENSFAIEGTGLAGRTYSCLLEDLRDMSWNDLVEKVTAYMRTDWYRNKQLIQQQQEV